jgi:long-chain acyl-CoA synthetase
MSCSDPILDPWASLVRRRPGDPLVLSTARAMAVGEVDRWALDCAGRAERSCPGELVALAADNGPGFLAAFVGLRRAGCVVLLLDARAPRGQRRALATSFGARALAEVREPWPHTAGWLLLTPAAPQPATLSQRDTPPLPVETAVLKLTSGSTGTPRAIAVSGAALVADDRQLAATMRLRPDERILAAVPLSHSYGFSSIALPALLRGSPILVPDLRRPWGALSAAHRLGATFVPAVPALLDPVARARQPPPPSAELRLLVSAGAPLLPATARAVRERWGHAVRAFYGASECGGIAFDREGGAAERGTVGTPVDGVAIDVETDQAAGPGRVTVKSAAVAASYVPRPQPELAGGVYRSADLASWRDSELVLRGRIDDLINVKGKKVHPGEVEDVIRRLPGVVDVLVLAAPAPGGGELVKAVVVPGDRALDPEAVRRFSQAHLAEHQVPRSVVLVSELPRNARGKVDRAAAREVVELEPAPR